MTPKTDRIIHTLGGGTGAEKLVDQPREAVRPSRNDSATLATQVRLFPHYKYIQ